MKAWLVKDPNEFEAAIIFASTRNKARYLALNNPVCEDCTYTTVWCRRIPIADRDVEEGSELDWENPEDRLFLVKDCGFACEYVEPYECRKCSAKEYCGIYLDAVEEYGDV